MPYGGGVDRRLEFPARHVRLVIQNEAGPVSDFLKPCSTTYPPQQDPDTKIPLLKCD